MTRIARSLPWARHRSRVDPRPWSCGGCNGTNPGGTRYCGHCGLAAGRADVVDENRLITALFADISGFTTLADRLDTADLHRVISPVIGVLTSVAERYEGTIAKYAGDAVLVFFGAPIAVEDHAERAVACALDMHRALRDAIPRLPEEAAHLELHVGVNTGRVIAGMAGGDIRNDYSILGDAVNVAQRLESVASPGETYVGAMTQELAGHAFEFEDLGGLTLKGKPEPVPAWRVVGARQSPEPATPRSASTFVGRVGELAALQDAVRRLTAGAGGVATVIADPGQGKSRLLEEVRSRAVMRGCRWLEARSISYGATVPYWPFVDLLRRTLRISLDLDPQQAAGLLVEAFGTVSATAPLLVGRLLGVPMPANAAVDGLSPEAYNRQLSDAIADWIASAAASEPTVLVVEDVHWTDSASADLLQRLVRLVTASRLLVVLSGRREGEPTIARLAAGLDAAQRVDLRLEALDAASTGELVADMLGGPVSAETAAAIVDKSGGNAFFAQELVLALRSEGGVTRREGRWELVAEAVSAVPTTVEGVISARIDRLPRPVANVLLAASVVGRRVDRALLDGVTELDGHLDRMLDTLVDAGLLDRSLVDGHEVMTFHHALVVDVAYGRLVRRQRRDLHRRVAETSEVLYGSGDDVIDLLARHFYLAEAGVKAVDHLERAAARAKRLFANDQAITHLRCAIELCRERDRLTSRLPRLLLDLADVEQLISAYEEAAQAYAEVRDLTDDVRAWCGLSSVHRKWGRYDDAIVLVDEALRRGTHTGEDQARLWLERTAALLIEGRLDEAVSSAESGLELTRPDSPVAAELLLRLARTEETAGANGEAFAHAQAALALLERGDDLRALALAYRIVGGLQWNFGRHEEATATLQRGLAVAEQTGNGEEVAGCLVNLGLALLSLDRLDEAIECDERAIRLFMTSGHLNGQALATTNLAEKVLASGDLDRALRLCEEGLSLARQTGGSVIAAHALLQMAAVLKTQGRQWEASRVASEAAAAFESLGDAANLTEAMRLVVPSPSAELNHPTSAPTDVSAL